MTLLRILSNKFICYFLKTIHFTLYNNYNVIIIIDCNHIFYNYNYNNENDL